MTENERLNEALEDFETFCEGKALCVTGEALEMVRTAVKETQAYRAIGTAEEFKALKEKNEPKKPILKNGESLMHIYKGKQPHELRVNKWQDWVCPICGWFVGQRYNSLRSHGEPHPHDQRKSNYCNECGQRIDWGE